MTLQLCVCVPWAQGREVWLPYYEHLHLRSRLVTFPPFASCLLGLKVATGHNLPASSAHQTFRPAQKKVYRLIFLLSVCLIQLHLCDRLHPSLPASCVDAAADHHSSNPDRLLYVQAKLLFLFPPPLVRHSLLNRGQSTTYIVIVEWHVLM